MLRRAVHHTHPSPIAKLTAPKHVEMHGAVPGLSLCEFPGARARVCRPKRRLVRSPAFRAKFVFRPDRDGSTRFQVFSAFAMCQSVCVSWHAPNSGVSCGPGRGAAPVASRTAGADTVTVTITVTVLLTRSVTRRKAGCTRPGLPESESDSEPAHSGNRSGPLHGPAPGRVRARCDAVSDGHGATVTVTVSVRCHGLVYRVFARENDILPTLPRATVALLNLRYQDLCQVRNMDHDKTEALAARTLLFQ